MFPLRSLSVAPFRRLALTYTLNELAWAFGVVTLAVVVYVRTHSATTSALLFMASTCAPAVGTSFIATWLERWPVKRVLSLLYLVEAGCFVLLAFESQRLWVPAVIALAAVDGVLASSGRALTRSAVSAVLTPHDALEAGNKLLNASFAVCFAVGPAAAGLVISGAGRSTALAVTAIIFGTMAAVLATSRGLPDGIVASEDSVRARLREAVSGLMGKARTRHVIVGHAVLLTLAAAVSPLEVVYAAQDLGGNAGAYGALLSAWGLGTVIGSLTIGRVGRSSAERVLIAGATIGAGFALLASAPGMTVAQVGSLIGGIGNGWYYVSVVQTLQAATPQDGQTRLMAVVESVTAGAYAIGFALSAVAAATVGVRPTIALAAGGLLVGVMSLALVMRPRTDAPQSVPVLDTP